MLTHERVWAAIDALGPAVQSVGLRASPARPASTRPASTARNASVPRAASAGRRPSRSPRSWPPPGRAWRSSCGSWSRARRRRRTMIPLIGMAQAGSGGLFTEEGMPTGGPGWEEIEFPDLADREGVRARGARGRDGAALSRRRRADRLAEREHAQGRPGRRAHRCRRGHGEGAEAPHRARTIELRSPEPRACRPPDAGDGDRLDRAA